jgi:hypothetical protein
VSTPSDDSSQRQDDYNTHRQPPRAPNDLYELEVASEVTVIAGIKIENMRGNEPWFALYSEQLKSHC